MEESRLAGHGIAFLTTLLVTCQCGEEYWLDELDTDGQPDHLLTIAEAQDLLLDAHSRHLGDVEAMGHGEFLP